MFVVSLGLLFYMYMLLFQWDLGGSRGKEGPIYHFELKDLL